jgi:signal transduction histidine kinase
MRASRIVDLSVALGVAGWAVIYLHPARPAWWVAVLSVLAGLSGWLWRRPGWSLAVALLSDGAVVLPVGWLATVPDADEWNAGMCLVVAASLGAFTRPRVAAAAIVALGLSVGLGSSTGVVDLLWPVLPLGGTAVLAHMLARARRAAYSQRARAAELAATNPEQVARAAVAEERERLLSDVHEVIRAAIESMRTHANDAQNSMPAAAAAHAQAVQRDGREAIAELRRLLGLLRDTPLEAPASATADQPQSRAGLRAVDVAVALGVAAFAGLEPWLWRDDFDSVPPSTLLSVTLSAAGGAAILLRRVSPGAGAAAVGLLLGASAVNDLPVGFGFAMLVTVVALTWSAMGRARIWPGVGVGALFAGAWWYLAAWSASNIDLVLEVIAGTAVVSLATAHHRSAAKSSSATADRLAADRRDASDRAVRAERLTVAHELHDVVSHAVVVMTVQAGAAEALLPGDQAAARRALDLVAGVGASTLAELDRLFAAAAARPSLGAEANVSRDIPALVRRMQAGGLSVHLSGHPEPGLPAGSVAYRVVQETLTNTLRHAPMATVHLTVRSSATEMTVEVVDDGPGPARSGPARGYGLVGMTERVEHCGGTVETGPGPGGLGFRVFARIPVAEAGARS